MAENTNLEFAIRILRTMTDYKKIVFGRRRLVPLEFSEFSDYVMTVEWLWSEVDFCRWAWNTLQGAGVIVESECHTFIAVKRFRELDKAVQKREEKKQETKKEPVFDNLERTDLKDFKEKSKVVIGILSKYGRQGASFAKLYRLGWEKKKISRGDMKAILGILMGRGVIRCEDDMYYLI